LLNNEVKNLLIINKIDLTEILPVAKFTILTRIQKVYPY